MKCASCEAIFRNYREQVLLFHAISWRGHSLDTGLLVPCPLTKCTCLSNCILWSMDSLDPLHSIANCRVCCSIRALDNYLCNFILGTGEKNNKTSQGNENSDQGVYIDPSQALDKLLHLLTRFNTIFQKHGLDPQLISRIFRETFYYICAGTLNNILLRKDMCHWSKGMQIRYNVAQVNL